MEKKSKLSQNVIVLGLVSFFNDFASEMVYPIVPIFLTTVLGAPVALVGLIEGIADSTTPEIMGKAFGFHRALDTAGAVFGPLAAILFITGNFGRILERPHRAEENTRGGLFSVCDNLSFFRYQSVYTLDMGAIRSLWSLYGLNRRHQ